jgi:hypothetical protein
MLHAIALSVVIHLFNAANVPAPVVARAQSELARVYRDIGVSIEWLPPADAHIHGPDEIHVILIPYETGGLQQNLHPVLGAAIRTPHGTKVAYVFYRRVEAEAAQYSVSPAFILACAMAHEIGHLLLPGGLHEGGHSPTGLMRPTWNRDDFIRADRGQPRFDDDQAALIRDQPQQ